MSGARYKALLVGAHEFPRDPANLLRLHGPLHDLPAIRAALANRETGLVADHDVVSLLNPTKVQAEHAIHELFSAARRDDILVFYFSGHGRLTRENKLFLCASDTTTARIQVTGIAAATLRDCMEASEAQTFVVILDCCHSGAFRGGRLPSEVLGGRGAFVLSSSRAHQLADDGDGRAPSPFTAAIVDALQDAASDTDGDGLITFDDVYRITYARLALLKQFPQRSTGEGTVALARSRAGARAWGSGPSGGVEGAAPVALRALDHPAFASSGPSPSNRAGLGIGVPPWSAAPGSVLALMHEMHVRRLGGFAADAVIHAAAITEIALNVICGRSPEIGATLSERIDELRLKDTTEFVADASWLNQRRIAALPFTGQVREELDDDARRAGELALCLSLAAGLVTESEATSCQRRAEWQSSRPPLSALLRLDRAMHRNALDDLLELPRRVVVLLVHGEVGQGHDHFGEVMTWRLRSGQSGHWREVVVHWPPPSTSLGSRLAMLFEELANAVGVALIPPADDPSTPGGQRTWRAALAPILTAIDARRERLLVRHVLRWLGTGPGGDDALVDSYVRAIWMDVAARSGERVVVGLDLRRIEHGGVPLTKAWRSSRSELTAARAITTVLDRLDMPHGGTCIALPELTSVAVADLIAWLRIDGGRKRDVAEIEAEALVSSTRGGRFDLVVQRLTALSLDRPRSGK